MPHPPPHAVLGLYGIADAAASNGAPAVLAAQLIRGGCRLIQLRYKGGSAEDVAQAATAIRALTREAGAAFVVNDDPMLAARVGADGLHLGQLDGPISTARAQFSGWIGRSTHSLEDVAAALDEGADYVAFGPIFDTPNLSRSKPTRGLERLRQVRRAVPADVPLVAIGGITADRLPAVRAAGATAWAVIGAIAGAPSPEAMTRQLSG